MRSHTKFGRDQLRTVLNFLVNRQAGEELSVGKNCMGKFVVLLLGNKRGRGSSRDNTEKVIPTSNNSATVAFNQILNTNIPFKPEPRKLEVTILFKQNIGMFSSYLADRPDRLKFFPGRTKHNPIIKRILQYISRQTVSLHSKSNMHIKKNQNWVSNYLKKNVKTI